MNNNHRLVRCYRYHFSSAGKPMLVFLAIFCLVDFGLPLLAYLLKPSGSNLSIYNGFTLLISAPFLIAGAIFLFVGGYASFREDFNFLLALNNTRRNQFWSGLLNALTLAALFMAASVVIGLIERYLGTVISGQTFWKPGTQWSLPALASELVLPLGLFLAAYAFGQMGGVLSYRLGPVFTVAFWILFGISYVIVPIMAATLPWLSRFLAWFAGAGSQWPLLAAGWHLVALTLVFNAISGAALYKMPQNA